MHGPLNVKLLSYTFRSFVVVWTDPSDMPDFAAKCVLETSLDFGLQRDPISYNFFFCQYTWFLLVCPSLNPYYDIFH
jgi:hypothetical protein